MPEVQSKIVMALRLGNHLNVAAAAAGISEATVHRWRADRRPVYRAFDAAVTQAIAEFEVRTVALISQAASSHPAVAFKALERHHPMRWGPGRANLTKADDLQEPTSDPRARQDPISALPPEWLHPVIRILLAAKAGETPEEFFAGQDRLAGLVETDEPLPPWWKWRPDAG